VQRQTETHPHRDWLMRFTRHGFKGHKFYRDYRRRFNRGRDHHAVQNQAGKMTKNNVFRISFLDIAPRRTPRLGIYGHNPIFSATSSRRNRRTCRSSVAPAFFPPYACRQCKSWSMVTPTAPKTWCALVMHHSVGFRRPRLRNRCFACSGQSLRLSARQPGKTRKRKPSTCVTISAIYC